jgi:amino acid adenylation domain-containing protein
VETPSSRTSVKAESNFNRPVELLCAHEAFERMVVLHPESVAVVCGSTRWTYDQLNRKANAVAHYLVDLGVEHEEPVAIALTKSCEMIAALLGVLKAGGAYVPLVDNQPISRLKSIVHDVSCRFMISEDGYLDELNDDFEQVLSTADCGEYPVENLDRDCTPHQLAYIIYTSGSTGVPKGVMIEHNGIIRLVHDQWFMDTGTDRSFIFLSSLSFDASTIEIYSALLHGAKLVICPMRVPSPDQVYETVQAEGVKSAFIAFGFFRALFRARPDIFEHIDLVMTGGEPVLNELMEQAQKRLPNTRFVAVYGPTEATALSTGYIIPRGFDNEHNSIPIGIPLKRMRAYILGVDQKPVAVGQLGELYVGGIGIGRGYLNRYELSEKHFLPDPFSNEPNARMYRTGDRVSQRADGNMLFHGRIDDQVKIRGNRIELGEIEAALNSVPQIQASGVVVLGQGEEASVGACVILNPGETIDQQCLSQSLSVRLPEHGIPQHILVIDALPVNRNGKVDRNAIALKLASRSHDELKISCGKGFATHTQQQLASIMSTLLDTQVQSSNDHFLQLGGHSLRAVVLSSRVRDQFGISLPISEIYKLATVENLASWIEDEIERAGQEDIKQHRILKVVDQGSHSPLSFNQERLWMLDQINPHDPSYNITIRFIHTGPIDRSCFEQAWNTVCARHDVLRSRIEVVESQPCHVVEEQYEPIVRWVSCNEESQDSIDQMIVRESMRVFDLETLPLHRCCVFEEDHRASIVVSMHHIISDAWSFEVIQHELNEAYSAAVELRVCHLEDLPVQYKDFAFWQRQLPESSRYKADLEYWKTTLSGFESIELPLDYQRGSKPTGVGCRVNHKINAEDSKRIRAAADLLGVTPNAYMLAIFKVWIHRLTGQEDLIIGTPIANREWTEIEGLVGFFMETTALRNRLACQDRLRDVIAQVSENALQAFDHRDVPFQHIVDAIPGHTSNGLNPLFEVFFNHIALNIRTSSDTDVIRFEDSEVDNKSAKFDLTCYVYDDSDSIEVVFNYRKELFLRSTINRFLDQYTRLLINSVAHFDSPLSQIPILCPHELCDGVSDQAHAESDKEGLSSQLIHRRVEQTVRQFPCNTAVSWAHGSLTYDQLWKKSDAVLDMLNEQGLKSGDCVLVCSQDPGALAAAILGVLRLGGVYIPLDPYWPDHRKEQIAQAVFPEIAIVDSVTCEGFESMECIGKVLTHEQSDSPLSNIIPEPIEIEQESPAYMLFTSGSTGNPKGVVQSHAGVESHMSAFAESLKLTSDDRVLQVSSPAFDAAVMDMFAAWFSGSTLCFCDIQRTDHHELADFIDSNSITIYHSVPSIFRWFTGSIEKDKQFNSVRVIVLGGEPVLRDDVNELNTHFPHCDLFINGLGLTESSLTLQLRIHPTELQRYTRWIPVGFPVPGSRVRLVDCDGHPTDLTGEIEIESTRTALGYWNSESKLINPIGQHVSGTRARRFRTGDRGTRLADGSIVHIGRIDQQVQIHGCRVEVEEVATAIKLITGVADAGVLAKKLPNGDHELHSYVVIKPDQPLSAQALRDLLSSTLPGYMIPVHWSCVEKIIRVGGGKIDKRGMQSVRELDFPMSAHASSESPSQLVKRIVSAFTKILDEPTIGINDNFFQLGGNSLKAIRVFSILRKELGTDLPIATIYRASTPLQLAEAINSQSLIPDEHESLILLSKNGDHSPVYMLPGIGGQPMGFRPLVDRLSHDRSYIGIQYPDISHMKSIGYELKELASWLIDQMELENTRQSPDLIGYSFGGALAMETAIQLQDRGFEPGQLILLDAHLPFGLPKKGKAAVLLTHLKRLVRGSDQGRVSYIRSKIAGTQYTSQTKEAEDQSDLAEFKALAQINRRMIINYSPSSIYKGRVRLLRAIQPEWLVFHTDDGYNGWSAVADPTMIQIDSLYTSHMKLLKENSADDLAALVQGWLD